MVILETERLILRPWRESDAEDLYEYAKDPRVGPMAGWPVHRSVGESRQIIRTVLTNPLGFALEEKSTGKVIGSGGLVGMHRDWLPGEDDEIGYVLNPAYWGRGLVPEAMAELLRYGFEELGLDHIWCGYYEGNEKSRRVQEKLRFRPFGQPREVEVPLLGERRVEHYTVMTKEEWQAK